MWKGLLMMRSIAILKHVLTHAVSWRLWSLKQAKGLIAMIAMAVRF